MKVLPFLKNWVDACMQVQSPRKKIQITGSHEREPPLQAFICANLIT